MGKKWFAAEETWYKKECSWSSSLAKFDLDSSNWIEGVKELMVLLPM